MNPEFITLSRGVVAIDGEPVLRFDTNIAAAEFLILRCGFRYERCQVNAGSASTFLFAS